MLRSFLWLGLAVLAVTFAGCRKPDLVLHQPETAPTWRTVVDVEDLATEQSFGPTADRPHVLLATSEGDITVELFAAEAPITVENFFAYMEADFYDGTIFHRVIPGFMIQGGGFTEDMTQKPTEDPIRNEAGNGLRNQRGTLAMARTSVLDSATSQFFINVADNTFLNGDGIVDGYAVFGRVIGGMEIVDQIAITETGTVGTNSDVPVEPVIILSITRL